MSFDICCVEGCDKPIVNKKYELCKRHNWERIHGEDYYEHKRKKQDEYRRKARQKAIDKGGSGLSRGKPLRKKSRKQSRVDRSISDAYEVVQERDDHRCTGCGKVKNLSHSHLVPRSHRKDLRDAPRNIVIQCVVRNDGSEGCHQRYEKFRAFELDNFDDIMERLKDLDETYYMLYKEQMEKKRNET